MSVYYLGFDWAAESHQVCILDASGSQVLNRSFQDTREGFSELGGWLYEQTGNGIDVLGAIEKPEGRVVDFLLDHGVSVYAIPPKVLDRVRDRYRANPSKSDAFDAYVLADFLRTDGQRLSALEPNSDRVAELKILTRDYHTLLGQQTRLVNQLRACLKEYYPLVLDLFKDLSSPATLDFIRLYPRPDTLVDLKLKAWQSFGKRHRYRQARIASGWQQLQKAPYPMSAHVGRARSRLALSLIQQLEVLVTSVESYKQEIEDFFSNLPVSEYLKSLPGGQSGVTLPSLYAELGDASSRWHSFRHLQGQAGTTPYTKESGKHKGAHFRFACNKHLRYHIYWFAQNSLIRSEWARAYYDGQRARGQSHRQALRALGAKWLKILYVLWRDQVPYNENRHLANIARAHLRQAVFA